MASADSNSSKSSSLRFVDSICVAPNSTMNDTGVFLLRTHSLLKCTAPFSIAEIELNANKYACFWSAARSLEEPLVESVMKSPLKFVSGKEDSPPLISRASVLILALVLIGMGVGSELAPDWARTCLSFGYLGLAAYLALEIAQTYRSWLKLLRNRKLILHRFEERISSCFASRHSQHGTNCDGVLLVNSPAEPIDDPSESNFPITGQWRDRPASEF